MAPKVKATITKVDSMHYSRQPPASRVVVEFDPQEFHIHESSASSIARIVADALKHRRELARIAGREQGALQILTTALELAKREIEKLSEQVATQFVDPVVEEQED